MKAIISTIFILNCVFLSAVTLISDNFISALPSGWTESGPTIGHWIWSDSNNAGGLAGELKFTNLTYSSGTFKFISPVFDTQKVHDMVLSFRQKLVDAISSNEYTISVMLSTDLENWDPIWSLTGSSNYGPFLTIVNIEYWRVKSSTTYLAFTFTGNTQDLSAWYIDEVSLTYTDTFGGSTWTTGNYYPVGDIVIPNGYTLSIGEGSNVYMEDNTRIDVQGRLVVNGTTSANVCFSSVSGTQTWKGIDIHYVDLANDSTLINHAVIEKSYDCGISIQSFPKVRLSECSIRLCGNTANGGGVYCDSSNIVMEHCDFYQNETDTKGTATYFEYCTPTFSSNHVHANINNGTLYSIVCFNRCDLNGVADNFIVNNEIVHSGYALCLSSCSGTFSRNLIANNSYGVYITSGTGLIINNCDVINNDGSIGITSLAAYSLINSIVWGHGGWQVYNGLTSTVVTVSYCCIESGFDGTFNIASSCYQNSISGDPLFVYPTSGSGIEYDAYTANWTLQNTSPCIDTADPAFPLNPDGSREDMGMYYRQLRPIITKASDYPNDQGHRLDITWKSSDIDVTFYAGAFYSIWSEGSSRSADVVYITDPSVIQFDQAASEAAIAWRDGDRTWYYLEQVPAAYETDYGCYVESMQDSSSTGTHAVNYKIRYHNNNGIWTSSPVSGYTVDNIPPAPPARLDIARTGSGTYNLTWDEVTGGYLNGNFEEEINGITYKVYASDTCDFIPGPANFLLSTTDPAAILLNQTADQKFYKITASDSE